MANSVAALAPAWMDGVAVNGAQLRREILGGLLAQAGIVKGLAAAALPTPAMKVRLPAGLAAVDDTLGGFYPVALSTQTDLDIAASSATQARIDSLIAQVIDNGNNTSTYVYRIITGTPAGSPVPPTLPPSDAPGAFTLRLANIFVQINAETNGFVRAQDVTVVALSATGVYRPLKSDQVSNPSFGTTGSAVDFTSGQWPPLTFTAPPSGMVWVTVGASLRNPNTSTSTVWCVYRMSGGYTLASQFETGGISAEGNSRLYASRRKLITGITPGVSVVVTPQWQISSGNASTAQILGGQLAVEPVA